MSWTYTDEWYKEYTRDTWNESASRYQAFLGLLAPYNPPLFRAASPRQGERVLDVGTGPGEPALTLARMVGPQGKVLGVDLSERMIELAKERAKQQGLDNAEFQVMDAEELELDDGSFELVTNRFGLQIFTDPEKAIAESHRVLAPGGRFATSVWAAPGERVPHIHVLIGPMLELAEPDETGYIPTPYEMGGEGELVELLEAAGFTDVREERASYDYVFASADEYLETMLEGTPVGHSLEEEDEDVQASVLADARENLEAYTYGDALVIPGEAAYVVGTK